MTATSRNVSFPSAITIMEPRFGARLQLSRNALFAQELEQWIETVIMVNCSDRSLPFDTA